MKPIRLTWQHLLGTIGRRGCSMLFLALLDLVYGWSICTADAATRAEPAYRYFLGLLPDTVWAAAWITVGLICLACAPATQDRLGFACAAALKAGWGLVYLVGWVSGAVPHGYAGAAIWLAAAAWILIISTWPEAPPRSPGRDGGPDGR